MCEKNQNTRPQTKFDRGLTELAQVHMIWWPVPVGSLQEDMAASGCKQNNTSKLGRLDLLHQKVVDLAPPYLQCYGAVIWYTNILS